MSSLINDGHGLVLTCQSVATLSNLLANLFVLKGVRVRLRVVHKFSAHVPIPFPHVSIMKSHELSLCNFIYACDAMTRGGRANERRVFSARSWMQMQQHSKLHPSRKFLEIMGIYKQDLQQYW